MKEKTKSFAAGLMDAEGCFRVAKQSTKSLVFYSPRVYLSNKSRRIMKWMILHFGGQFSRNIHKKGKDWYVWYLQSRQSVPNFVSLIKPYLKLKKNQSLRVFRFCKEYDSLTVDDKEYAFKELTDMKKTFGSVTTDTSSNYIKSEESYLAGFFDGEGHINVSPKKSGDSVGYTFELQVTNKHIPSLELFKDRFGGSIRPKEKKGVFDWHLSGRENIEKTLLPLLPYLVIKKEEAILALEYSRIPDHTVCPEKRAAFSKEIKRLRKLKIQSELCGDAEITEGETLHVANT